MWYRSTTTSLLPAATTNLTSTSLATSLPAHQLSHLSSSPPSAAVLMNSTVLLKSAMATFNSAKSNQEQQQLFSTRPTDDNCCKSIEELSAAVNQGDPSSQKQFILIQNSNNVINIQINSTKSHTATVAATTTATVTANADETGSHAVSKVQIPSNTKNMFHEVTDSNNASIKINLLTKSSKIPLSSTSPTSSTPSLQLPVLNDHFASNSVYYLESISGQCSPSDTLDSGTCSDLDGSPPPLPKKKNPKPKRVTVNRSLTDQSDETDSPISYDSLNSAIINEQSVTEKADKESNSADTYSVSKNHLLPRTLLDDIRDKQKILKTLRDTQPIKTIIYRTKKEQFDSFYDFHLKENEPLTFENGTFEKSHEVDAEHKETMLSNENFAGLKNVPGTNSLRQTEAIRSANGTIRGVRNRVKAGIATFLHIQSTEPNYLEKEQGKIVVYTTTMGIVRQTFHQCAKVKQILRTLMVKFEERDIFMSCEYQNEIKGRLNTDNVTVPQLFVDGILIGDSEAVERLNESGELRRILKPFKSVDACTTCCVCGGYRLLPCPICNGSKKSVHRNHFTAEFVALKCMNCDEVGLVRCANC